MNWIVENILKNEYLINWLSAIGTVGAVWVSLWMSRPKKKLNISMTPEKHSDNYFIDNPVNSLPMDVLSINFSNNGNIPVFIKNIKIEANKEILFLDNDLDLKKISKLPMKVLPFDEEVWYVSKYILDALLKSRNLSKSETIKIIIIENSGKKHKIKYELNKKPT